MPPNETLISLSKAARIMPGRPAASSLYRWATKGVRGVVLSTTLAGGRRLTSEEAVRRFCEAINQSEHQRATADMVADGC